MIKIIDENFNQKIFDEKAYHPLQSWAWGKARKKMGLKILRLGEFKGNQLINVYTITFHKIPFISYLIGYLPRSVVPSQKITDFLFQYGKKNKIIFIKIEPYFNKSQILNSKFQIKNKKYKIEKSPHPLFPDWTQILDITLSEEELLKNMHPKTRYNIRLAQKKGVIIKEESNIKGFEIFSKLYFETCRRQGYFGHDLKYHQIVWESLKNKIAHILIAYYQNEPLAAYQIWIYKNVAYYTYGGSSIKYRNLMGNNLLMWEAIKLAKNLGAKKFDMWGSLPPSYSSNHPWAGFTRFKQGYGGKFIKMPGSFDLIINKPLYSLYNFAFILRRFFLTILKNFN